MFDPRLKHVVAVARAASFTKAAAAIGVTQSAVTKNVADLEQRLGYSIFYRTARGAMLTEEGRLFVEGASRLLEDARELMSRRPDDDPYAGSLRIGVCPQGSLEWLLTQPLNNLLKRHPRIRLEVTGGRFESVVQLLRSGTVDVAVGFEAAFEEWSDLRREPISALNMDLFVRAGHPLLERSTVTVSDLAAFPFVSPSDLRPYGTAIHDLYSDRGMDWRDHVHVVDFLPAVRGIVATSDAIGMVEKGAAASNRLSDQFVLLPPVDLLPIARMCCAVRSRWEVKPAVRAFIRIMQATLPPSTPMPAGNDRTAK